MRSSGWFRVRADRARGGRCRDRRRQGARLRTQADGVRGSETESSPARASQRIPAPASEGYKIRAVSGRPRRRGMGSVATAGSSVAVGALAVAGSSVAVGALVVGGRRDGRWPRRGGRGARRSGSWRPARAGRARPTSRPTRASPAARTAPRRPGPERIDLVDPHRLGDQFALRAAHLVEVAGQVDTAQHRVAQGERDLVVGELRLRVGPGGGLFGGRWRRARRPRSAGNEGTPAGRWWTGAACGTSSA